MTKSSFETLYKVLQAIPNSFLKNRRDFDVECSRICIEHGWTLEEYDAEEALWLKTLGTGEDMEDLLAKRRQILRSLEDINTKIETKAEYLNIPNPLLE